MVRKFIAGIAVVGMMLFASATAAVAAPYGDDTPVSSTDVSGTQATQSSTEQESSTAESSQTTDVSGTQATQQTEAANTKSESIEVLPTQSTQKGSLSYTGVSFNVPLTITIAALIVILGFALTVVGGRSVLRHRRQH